MTIKSAGEHVDATRLVALEAVRGWAAILVFVSHFMLAFTPITHGLLKPEAAGLIGTPFFALVNGTAAVTLFFVLSGFVLTYRALETRALEPLARSAVKRWPRLVFPILLVNLASGGVAAAGLYFNHDLSIYTGSDWLTWFFKDYSLNNDHLLHAGAEGALWTFVNGSAYYNSNLWTIWYEFIGSYLAFALAGVCIMVRSVRAQYALALLAAVAATFIHPLFMTFAAGVMLALANANGLFRADAPTRKWASRLIGLAMTAFAVLAFGYMLPIGFYAPLASVPVEYQPALTTLLHTFAACVIIAGALRCATLRRRLETPFAALIGRLSFPVYLTHFIIICSASSWLYLQLEPTMSHGWILAAVFPLTALAVLAVSYPLSLMDQWWLGALKMLENRFASGFRKARQPDLTAFRKV